MGKTGYHLVRLIDPARDIERFHDPESIYVIEHSPRGKRLAQLINKAKSSDTIVVPSLFNLGDPVAIIKIIPRCLNSGITLRVLYEDLLLDPRDPSSQAVAQFCEHLHSCMKLENREGKKRASLITAYLHAQNTRRCDPETRYEVETLLKQGHGIRATARLMKGRIGKTTVAKIAKEIKGA